jgi:cobalt-zinc-cadmium efflux system membrane fusion protein
MKLNTFGLALSLLIVGLGGGCVPTGDDGHHAESEEAARGPHGGWLLVEGDLRLELAILEYGIPPEFRAWVSDSGVPIAPERAELEVRLTRLGGVVDEIRFSPAGDYLRGDREIVEPHSFHLDVSLKHGGRSLRWDFDSFEGRTQIADEMAERFGLDTEVAGPADIREELQVFGRIVADPEAERQIAARFPGMVRSVSASLGDRVREGDLLAQVESDESLNRYDVRSPIDGVIVFRGINPGEHSKDRVLFTVRDTSSVWAEFAVFPRDLARIDLGMPVSVSSASGEPLGDGRVDWIDVRAGNDQAVRIRSRLINRTALVPPGSLVSARITVANLPVAVAVRRTGLQSFRGGPVVFARVGDEYEVRMLELGREDADRVEVLKGLRPGERYVTRNSYLVKADIEKAGAVHEH